MHYSVEVFEGALDVLGVAEVGEEVLAFGDSVVDGRWHDQATPAAGPAIYKSSSGNGEGYFLNLVLLFF